MRRGSESGRRAALALAATLGLWAAGCGEPGAESPPGPAAVVEVVGVSPVGPVLLVGIDGATLDLVEPLSAAGRLPNLAGLIERGAVGRLATLEPTLSPAIWTTIATGKHPAEHGILGFDGVPGQTMTTLPTSGMRRVRAFWDVLSEHGRSVGVVGWWATWPAEKVRGYVVSDRATYTRMEAAIRDEQAKPGEVYPPDLAEQVAARVHSPGAITLDDVQRFGRLDEEEFERWVRGATYRHGELLTELKYVVQSDRSAAEIAAWLERARPTDVAAVALYGVDAMSHLAWHLMDPQRFPPDAVDPDAVARFGELIPRYYEFVDELLGELIAAAPADVTVVVFSDHGFGPTGRLPWSGGHGRITPGAPIAPPGMLVLAGPPVPAGVTLDGAHVLDLLPTLLALQGLPAAEDMPGRVLAEALRPEVRARVVLPRVATYETGPRAGATEPPAADPELDRELLEKLRKLGYLGN